MASLCCQYSRKGCFLMRKRELEQGTLGELLNLSLSWFIICKVGRKLCALKGYYPSQGSGTQRMFSE